MRTLTLLTRGPVITGQQATGAKRSGARGGDVISGLLPTQGTVAVGKKEVEYLALSEDLLDVIFAWQMQEFMVTRLKSRPNHKEHSSSSSTKRLQAIYRVSHRPYTLKEVTVLIHYFETGGQRTDVRTQPLDWKSLANHIGVLMDTNMK